MIATTLYRQNVLRRRTIEFVAGFIVAAVFVVGVIGFLATQARTSFGCAVRSIATASARCDGLAPGPAAQPADVRVVFESDSPR